MDLDKFIINSKESIKNAIVKIDENRKGFILVKSSKNKIIGIATDGDIRRQLLIDPNLNSKIETCTNQNFIFHTNEISHELIYKQLSSELKAIPILNSKGELLNIITKDNIPKRIDQKFYARSKSPVRISFGGGGSDTSNFINRNNGAVINSTISLYAHATLRKRDDLRIHIESFDLNEKVEFESLNSLNDYNGKLGLILSLIKTISPEFGFELFVYSDFPISSGLGGSSAVLSSIIGCFNLYKINKWNDYEMAEIIYEAERINLGIQGGWQDQYATVFGGFNLIEFKNNENLVIPLKLNQDSIHELEESLILCYTNSDHGSNSIHEDQKNNTNKKSTLNNILKNVKLTYKMRDLILKSNFNELGQLLDKSWKLKKTFSSKISNSVLDNIYSEALKNGAVGGKLLGAGGGGFFMFYVPFENKNKLMNWIRENENLEKVNFHFEKNGLQAWINRTYEN